MSDLTEQEAATFVGRNKDYYLRKWQSALEGTGNAGNATGFNWAAFLLSGLWLPYRKMFRVASILLRGDPARDGLRRHHLHRHPGQAQSARVIRCIYQPDCGRRLRRIWKRLVLGACTEEGRRGAKPSLDVSQDGVRLTSSKSRREIWTVRWDELDEIVAYKEDALVVDHICLAFRKRAEDSFHVTDEETAGWEDLNRALAERFGIEQSRWHGDVVAPAFVENWTVLWRHAT